MFHWSYKYWMTSGSASFLKQHDQLAQNPNKLFFQLLNSSLELPTGSKPKGWADSTSSCLEKHTSCLMSKWSLSSASHTMLQSSESLPCQLDCPSPDFPYKLQRTREEMWEDDWETAVVNMDSKPQQLCLLQCKIKDLYFAAQYDSCLLSFWGQFWKYGDSRRAQSAKAD